MKLGRMMTGAALLFGTTVLMSLSGCGGSESDSEADDLNGPSMANSSGSTIGNIAPLYLGYGPCTHGGFVSPSGTSSCNNGVPAGGWCDEFAGFVWAKSGVVDTRGLGTGPGGFVDYAGSALSQTPHVGDVAVMSPPGTSRNSHVAIVTAVDSYGVATLVGGNEGGGQGTVARSYYWAGLYERIPVDSYHYHVKGYVAPRLK
jgi:hypothetical protein